MLMNVDGGVANGVAVITTLRCRGGVVEQCGGGCMTCQCREKPHGHGEYAAHGDVAVAHRVIQGCGVHGEDAFKRKVTQLQGLVVGGEVVHVGTDNDQRVFALRTQGKQLPCQCFARGLEALRV